MNIEDFLIGDIDSELKEITHNVNKSETYKIYCLECGFIHEFIRKPTQIVVSKRTVRRRDYECFILTDAWCDLLEIPKQFVGETIVIENMVRETIGFKCAVCGEIVPISERDVVKEALITPTDISGDERFETSIGCKITDAIYATDLNHPKWKFNQKKLLQTK